MSLQAIPFLFALMARKNEVAYKRLFSVVKDVMPQDFQPEHVMTDFETGLRNAAKSSFPAANLHGCHFHFCQVSCKKMHVSPTDAY